MISDIYIPSISILKRYGEEQPFHKFVIEEYPECIRDHLPGYISFKSITYLEDVLIDAFLEMLVSSCFEAIDEMKEKGLEVELGYYHLQLESDNDLTRKALPEIEFIFQKLHEEYSFISSYQYYLDEEGICSFMKMWTFESDSEEADDLIDNLHEYTQLFDSYFYEGKIPNCYIDEVAKWMLLQGRL